MLVKIQPDYKITKQSFSLILLVLLSFLFFSATSNKSIPHSRKYVSSDDTLTKNTVVLVPIAINDGNAYAKVLYTGNLDTLIHAISSAHKCGQPKTKKWMGKQTFYWKIITKPYLYYGGQSILVTAKKRPDWYEVRIFMSLAHRKPKHRRNLLPVSIHFYQTIVTNALTKTVATGK